MEQIVYRLYNCNMNMFKNTYLGLHVHEHCWTLDTPMASLSTCHHKGESREQIPVVAIFENADICSAPSGCDTTNIQLFCPNVLHNITNALDYIKISPMTVLMQNGYLLPDILVSYPLILKKIPFW